MNRRKTLVRSPVPVPWKLAAISALIVGAGWLLRASERDSSWERGAAPQHDKALARLRSHRLVGPGTPPPLSADPARASGRRSAG